MAAVIDPRKSLPLDARAFSWDAATKIASEEASTIQFNNLQRIYPNRDHAGVAILNPDTGRAVWFYLVEEERDTSDEIIQWEFAPIPESVKREPRLEGWKLIIVND